MNYLEDFLANNGREWLMVYALRLVKGQPELAEDLVQDTLTWAASSTAFDITKGEYKKWLGMQLWGRWKLSFASKAYVDPNKRGKTPEAGLDPYTQVNGLTHLTSVYDIVGNDQFEHVLATSGEEQRYMQHHDIAWALAQLTPKERALITWHDLEGCTCEEVSDRYRAVFKKKMTRHRQHVGRLIRAIRAKLRGLLSAYAPERGHTGSLAQSCKTWPEQSLAA